MLQSEVIYQDEYDEIQAKRTEVSKARLFVVKLKCKPPPVIQSCLQILRKYNKGYLVDKVDATLNKLKQSDKTKAALCVICFMTRTVDIRDIGDYLFSNNLLAEDIYDDMVVSDNPQQYRMRFWKSVKESVHTSECSDDALVKLIDAMGDKYKHITSYLQKLPKDWPLNCCCTKRRKSKPRPESDGSVTDMSTTEQQSYVFSIVTNTSSVASDSTVTGNQQDKSNYGYVKLRQVNREVGSEGVVELRADACRIKKDRSRKHSLLNTVEIKRMLEEIQEENQAICLDKTSALADTCCDHNHCQPDDQSQNSNETSFTYNCGPIVSFAVRDQETCRKHVISVDETKPKQVAVSDLPVQENRTVDNLTVEQKHIAMYADIKIIYGRGDRPVVTLSRDETRDGDHYDCIHLQNTVGGQAGENSRTSSITIVSFVENHAQPNDTVTSSSISNENGEPSRDDINNAPNKEIVQDTKM